MMNRAQMNDRLHLHRDPGFRKELINSMVDDLMKLQKSIQEILLSNDVTRSKMCIEVNATMIILDNLDFIKVIDEISFSDNFQTKYSFFNRVCTGIVQGYDPYSVNRRMNVY